MDIRQLYDRSLTAPPDPAEREELQAYLEAYPYCAVLYYVQARWVGEEDNRWNELAAIYARDRNRLNTYLSVRINGQPTEQSPQPAAPTLEPDAPRFDLYASIISWRLDTLVNIWVERTRERVEEVLRALQVTERTETPSSRSASSSSDILSWVQEITAKAKAAPAEPMPQPEPNESAPVETHAEMSSDETSAAVSTENIPAVQEIALAEPTAPVLETQSTTTEPEPDDQPEYPENWREHVPDFVEVDVKPAADELEPSGSPNEIARDSLDLKAQQLENDIKARIRRAKELLRRSTSLPTRSLPDSRTSASEPRPTLEELRSNIRLIREAAHTEAPVLKEIPDEPAPAASNELKSDYDPTRFLDRFIVPEFDPKATTLSAYRDFITTDRPEDPPLRTHSFDRFVPPDFDLKPDSLRIPPRLPDPSPTVQLESSAGFVAGFAAPTHKEEHKLEEEPAAQVPTSLPDSPPAQSKPLTERLRTPSFDRFIEPVFEPKVKTKAESLPIDEITRVLQEPQPEPIEQSVVSAEPTHKVEIESIESSFAVVESSSLEVSSEITPDLPPKTPTNRPIEPIRSESFTRFVEPDFGTTPLHQEAKTQIETQPEPMAEVEPPQPTTQPTTPPLTEPIRSESFKRFVEPDFGTTPLHQEAKTPIETQPEPAAEVEPPQPTAQPATPPLTEPIRSESFKRFVEPDFGTTPLHQEPQPPIETQPEPTAEAAPAEPTAQPATPPLTEPIRSESFKRFIEPDFSTAIKKVTVASEPPAESIVETPTPEPAAPALAGSVSSEALSQAEAPELISPVAETLPTNLPPADVLPEATPPTEPPAPLVQPIELDLEKLQRIASEVARSAEEKLRADVPSRKPQTEAVPEVPAAESTAVSSTFGNETEQAPAETVEASAESSSLLPAAEVTAPAEISPLEQPAMVEPSAEAQPELEAIRVETVAPVAAQATASAHQTTIIRYPHGDLTVEIRLKPEQLKYFRSLEAVSPAPTSTTERFSTTEDNPEPIVSPELIKRRFEEQQRSQTGGNAGGTLEKVIIDYARQTIEFIVEPAPEEAESSPAPEATPETAQAAIRESIPIEAPAPAPPAVISYEPEDIRSHVPDYSEFLLKALSYKDSYTESEARTFLKLIYNRTEIKSPDFLEQTFDLPRILPIAPSPEPTVEDLRTSRELMQKLSSLDLLYAQEEEERSITAKAISAEDAEDLEHTSNEIDSRIDRFRSNLQRIRTKSIPSEANVSQIQDRYLSSILAAMLEEFETASDQAPVAAGDEEPAPLYDLAEIPDLKPADAEPNNSVDRVLDTFNSFEPILQAQLDRLRTREPELAELDDFSIGDASDDTEDELPPAVINESMARLLAQQGNIRQAERIYRSLQLKYPEKSDYFAAEIERLTGKQA